MRKYKTSESQLTKICTWVGIGILILSLVQSERKVFRLRRVIYWREGITSGRYIGADADSLKTLELRLIGKANTRSDMLGVHPKYPFFWDAYNEGLIDSDNK